MANRPLFVWWTILLGKSLFQAVAGALGSVFLKYMLTRFWGIPFWLPNFVDNVSWEATAAVGALLGAVQGMISVLWTWRKYSINRELAENNGLSFDDHVDIKEFRASPPFTLSQYKDLSVSQRMTGKIEGRVIDVFDVKYTVDSGGNTDSSTSIRQTTVFRFPGSGQGLVSFTNRPRTRIMDLLLAFAGLPVLELSPSEDSDLGTVALLNHFRKLYLILPSKTASHEEVQKIFHPFLLMWMTRNKDWNFESNGDDLLAWKSDKVFFGGKRLLRIAELQEWLALVEGAGLAARHSPPSSTKVLVFDNGPKSFSERLSQAIGKGVYGGIGFAGVAYLIVGLFWVLDRPFSPLWFLVLFPAGLFGFLSVGFGTMVSLVLFDRMKSLAKLGQETSKKDV